MLHKFCESASLCNDIIALSYLKFAGSSKESEKGKKGGAALWIILLAFRLKNLSFYTEKREKDDK